MGWKNKREIDNRSMKKITLSMKIKIWRMSQLKKLIEKIVTNGLVILLMIMGPNLLSAGEKEDIALEEVVVTATRTPTLTEEVGSSITVISAEEIEAKGQITVQEILKGTLGLDIRSSGGLGSSSSVSIRGAKPFQTLVLIDGVEMNDPSGANRGFDFGNLTVDNIERIEVLRGPQSPLYGSDAMGGVINIITKKGEGKPEFYLGAEGGSEKTWREFCGASMGTDRVNLSLAISHNSTDGFSTADDDLPGNSEKDKWENTTASTRMGFILSEEVDFDFTARLQKGRTHLDNGGGPFKDQRDYHVDEKRVFTRSQVNVNAFDGLWEQTLSYGYSDNNRDDGRNPWGDTEYDGKKYEVSWQNNLYLHETNTLTLGVEYEREQMDDHDALDESAYTTGFFIQDQIKLGNFSFTTVGLRYDDHEEFGSETTFRITQAFLLRDWGTKLKGSYGTGFRAPSLYELYAPPFWGPVGNPDLDPEESKGFDIGIEQALMKDLLTLGITYFNNDFDDLIDFDFANGYQNISDAKTSGIESFIKIAPLKNLSLVFNYTYTDTEDDTGQRRLRCPLHKFGFNTCYNFLERGTANLDILYVSKRDDVYWDIATFNQKDVVTDEYVVVNLAGSFNITDHLQVLGRIDNLFDEKYYEIYGYGIAGLSAFGGMKLTF